MKIVKFHKANKAMSWHSEVKVILPVDWSHGVQFKLLLMAHDVLLDSGI